MLSDYELARLMIRCPGCCYAEARTLRDVLAMVHGAAIARYPPHGSGFLPGFLWFVNQRFRAGPIAWYHVLLEQFGEMPLADACKAVLRLLEEWKKCEEQAQGRELSE